MNKNQFFLFRPDQGREGMRFREKRDREEEAQLRQILEIEEHVRQAQMEVDQGQQEVGRRAKAKPPQQSPAEQQRVREEAAAQRRKAEEMKARAEAEQRRKMQEEERQQREVAAQEESRRIAEELERSRRQRLQQEESEQRRRAQEQAEAAQRRKQEEEQSESARSRKRADMRQVHLFFSCCRHALIDLVSFRHRPTRCLPRTEDCRTSYRKSNQFSR